MGHEIGDVVEYGAIYRRGTKCYLCAHRGLSGHKGKVFCNQTKRLGSADRGHYCARFASNFDSYVDPWIEYEKTHREEIAQAWEDGLARAVRELSSRYPDATPEEMAARVRYKPKPTVDQIRRVLSRGSDGEDGRCQPSKNAGTDGRLGLAGLINE